MPEEYFSKIEQIAKSIGLKKSDVTRMAIRKKQIFTAKQRVLSVWLKAVFRISA
jgi:hypothetical protein